MSRPMTRPFMSSLITATFLATAIVGMAEGSTTASKVVIKKTTIKKSSKPALKQEKKKMTDATQKVVDLKTSKGTITVRFFSDLAPNHVKNFIELGEKGYYNGTKFHRVIPGFMIQGGDPNTKTADSRSWGMGGSGKNVKAEFNAKHHARGVLSMARSQDPDSASSQFFICVADAGFLDKQYTAFGEVVKGMEVADAIVSAPTRGETPVEPVAIESFTVRAAAGTEAAGGKK